MIAVSEDRVPIRFNVVGEDNPLVLLHGLSLIDTTDPWHSTEVVDPVRHLPKAGVKRTFARAH